MVDTQIKFESADHAVAVGTPKARKVVKHTGLAGSKNSESKRGGDWGMSTYTVRKVEYVSAQSRTLVAIVIAILSSAFVSPDEYADGCNIDDDCDMGAEETGSWPVPLPLTSHLTTKSCISWMIPPIFDSSIHKRYTVIATNLSKKMEATAKQILEGCLDYT